jgi:hypothetical protein
VSSIEYDLVPDDFVAFNMHHALHSEAARRQSATTRIGASVVLPLAVGIMLAAASHDVAFGAVTTLVSGVVLWFLWPRLWSRQMKRFLMRAASSDGLGTVGTQTLSIEDEGLREVSPGSETFTAWSKVRRIDETPDHVFIFVGPVQAFVIPKRIGEERVAAFMGDLRGHCAC